MTTPKDLQLPRGHPTLREAIPVWTRIGFLSFGGPAGQIALMHKEIVELRGWLSERQFLNALSFCMLLPGPEAMQLATYAGWRLHGTRGGLIAGLLFVLPGAACILLLAALYTLFGRLPVAQALFLGVKAAVLVIVVEALWRVSKRALKGGEHWAIAGLAFLALFFFAAPYPLVVAAAALWGLARGGRRTVVGGVESAAGTGTFERAAAPVSLRATAGTVLFWLALWWAPIAALDLLIPGSVFGDIARFFSVLATVTFGGAYAVLAYMAQEAVSVYGWLTAPEMADALGLAETTPGPLILVTEFVGFLAAARDGGGAADLLMGAAGAALTLWVTFVPCFLWIFAAAPYVERLLAQPRLKAALEAITAAVVGVILNLSIWFALQVAFREVSQQSIGPFTTWVPEFASLDWRVPVLAAVAGYLLLWRHTGMVRTLAASAALGFALDSLSGG